MVIFIRKKKRNVALDFPRHFIDGTLFQKGNASLESAFVMLYVTYLLWSNACFSCIDILEEMPSTHVLIFFLLLFFLHLS